PATGAIDAHPAMKASSPQAPVSEWFIGDDFRHNGALFLSHAFRFLSGFGQDIRPSGEPGAPSMMPFNYGTPDGYEFYLRTGPLQNFGEKSLPGKFHDGHRLTVSFTERVSCLWLNSALYLCT